MRLISCAVPSTAVSSAPLTALCDSHSVTVPTISQLADGRLVAAFWGLEDDTYYVRERSADGDAWFRLVDDEPSSPVAMPARARVTPIRARDHAVMRVSYRAIASRSRTFIVGVSHARSRGR